MPSSPRAIRPRRARLRPGDRARVTRALEVVLATGRSLLDWHDENKPATLDLAARRQSLSDAGSRRAARAASTRASTP